MHNRADNRLDEDYDDDGNHKMRSLKKSLFFVGLCARYIGFFL